MGFPPLFFLKIPFKKSQMRVIINTMEKDIITTNVYPVVPLRGKVAFPHTTISFEVGREMTVKAIKRASEQDKTFFILSQKQTEKDDVNEEDLYSVGCVAKIKQILELTGGAMRVVCQGLYRAKARVLSFENGSFTAVCDPVFTERGEEVMEEAHFRTVKAQAKDAFSADNKITKELLAKLERCEDAEEYADMLISVMRVRLDIKQAVLEESKLVNRLQMLERCLNDEAEISKIEKKIAASVRQNIDKNQKEYFLREQLKAIHAELGDDEEEADLYREKILEKGLPQELEIKCLKEIDRLSRMPSSAAEYTVIATYLDQVLALPWTEETVDTEALTECEKILNADHYGLDKIKERILEYLAVLKLTGSTKAPILCFVGPPGVGKTSIAESIACALGRKFVRMNFGGVKDEAEIRGHRRTYIGAMPGRILYGMKSAGVINPVFLLDEIDKISADIHGDPASALLEVLDPNQNDTFRDRFLEHPYDLSKVIFLTTANSLDTIPSPLRDRMEIIQLSGYTQEEKTEIAKGYLIPKQLEANGLTADNAHFTVGGIRAAIEGYTMEAGVRSLERTVGSICRKIAVQYSKDNALPKITVDKNKVVELLGAPKFHVDEDNFDMEIGAVNGLAWTAFGGTTLTIEASVMQGKGDIKLTGQLGEVMQESALIALSYIRANAKKYRLDDTLFEKIDLHIHVPEGATPKDGPSAGITLATAVLSALTGRKASGSIAMTGGITLRGKVLPIGGLKEKSLAARRLGIKTVIIPHGNARDLEELPKEVKEELTFIPVHYVDEVFERTLEGGNEFALTEQPEKTPRKRKEKATPVPLPTAEDRDSVRCERKGVCTR